MSGSKPREITWVEDENGCHICTSHKHNTTGTGFKGYYFININGKHCRLHRYIYSKVYLNGSDIPKGMVVRHKCNNPFCINPDHLEIGTPADNVRDMIKSGRNSCGEKHPSSKLTEDQVKEIFLNSTSIQAELAKRFGISHTVISLIKSGKIWKHITNQLKDNN